MRGREFSMTRSLLRGIISLLWPLTAAVHAQTYGPGTLGGNQTLQINVTQEPVPCVVKGECNVAGAVIGALLGGIFIGATIMFLVHCYLYKNKKVTAPPKDYDVPESRHFDVNRNNDNVQFSGHEQVTQNTSGVKGHKKLERLFVKPSTTPRGNINIPTAATPLINQNSSPQVEPPAAPTVDTPAQSSTKSVDSAEDTTLYANYGNQSTASQPYEALDIIHEETEYEQLRTSFNEDSTAPPPTSK